MRGHLFLFVSLASCKTKLWWICCHAIFGKLCRAVRANLWLIVKVGSRWSRRFNSVQREIGILILTTVARTLVKMGNAARKSISAREKHVFAVHGIRENNRLICVTRLMVDCFPFPFSPISVAISVFPLFVFSLWELLIVSRHARLMSFTKIVYYNIYYVHICIVLWLNVNSRLLYVYWECYAMSRKMLGYVNIWTLQYAVMSYEGKWHFG